MNRGLDKILAWGRHCWSRLTIPVPLKYEGTPAFNAGWRASDSGTPRRKNPHRTGSLEREAWFEGWDEQMKYEISLW
ncbi:TPA: ribosome modulation factor [Burkholderia multivorans]